LYAVNESKLLQVTRFFVIEEQKRQRPTQRCFLISFWSQDVVFNLSNFEKNPIISPTGSHVVESV